MPGPRALFAPEPRIWTETQVAKRLGFCVSWFRANRMMLESKGFPRRDDVFGRWDSSAIERWLDERAGLAPRSPTKGKSPGERWHGGDNDEIRNAPGQ